MIGLKIKAYLDENGIKQAFLANAVSIPPSRMSDICNGKGNIDCLLYWKICNVLKVPYETFMPEEEEK